MLTWRNVDRNIASRKFAHWCQPQHYVTRAHTLKTHLGIVLMAVGVGCVFWHFALRLRMCGLSRTLACSETICKLIEGHTGSHGSEGHHNQSNMATSTEKQLPTSSSTKLDTCRILYTPCAMIRAFWTQDRSPRCGIARCSRLALQPDARHAQGL